MAFGTLRHNLISEERNHYPLWPHWLPKEACSIQRLTKKYREDLRKLQNSVTLVAGGPPCQGFSYAGKRQQHDRRNQLYKSYIEVVELVRPAIVLLENVTGITSEFAKKMPGRSGRPPESYSTRIKRALVKRGYLVDTLEVRASDYGVPQSRVRFLAVGIDKSQFPEGTIAPDLKTLLAEVRPGFLMERGLPQDRPVSCHEALADLEYYEDRLADSPDTRNYKAGKLGEAATAYQKLMRGSAKADEVADSHRFVKHRPEIIARFAKILRECTRGKNLSDGFRKENNIRKACIVPLDPTKPASTLTTVPDDMIHYSQPRVLTVRECARLQSFPDWFQVRDKYTTGGQRRKTECPRYTQIGNAVPPLLAEVIARSLAKWLDEVRVGSRSTQPEAENERVA
jgi:DNA (cytosine-5)-methyltransferase 1